MRRRPLLLLIVVLGQLGCAHVIRLERTRPPILNLAPDRRLVVEVEAPTSGAPNVAEAVGVIVGVTKGQLLQPGLAVDPLRNEFRKQLQTSHLTLASDAEADTVVRVVVTDWTYRGPLPLQKGTGSGKLQARIEVLDRRAPGSPRLYVDDFWATASASNEAAAILSASQHLTGAFMRELQPVRVWSEVELDDSDPVSKAGIELCERGRFEAARLAFSDAVARHPTSAPSLYNLAVLEEARGEYAVAEALLLNATRIKPASLYYVALERVRASAAELELRSPR